MGVSFLLLAQEAAALCEQFSRFWTTFDGTRFDATGSEGENHLTDGSQNNCMACAEPSAWATAQIFLEGVKDLQRGLDAQLPRQKVPA